MTNDKMIKTSTRHRELSLGRDEDAAFAHLRQQELASAERFWRAIERVDGARNRLPLPWRLPRR